MIETNEQLFLRVVDAGSLKAAAEQIGADPSVVSRRIAALEHRLGVKLLQRSTRRSSPTEAGTRYYEGMRRLVEAQNALEADVAGLVETPTGRLRVTAGVDFGARFVAPVLASLQETYPALGAQLLLGSHFADLVEQGIDVAIRIGRLPDSSLIARRLGTVPRILVASPEYLERHGLPETPDALTSHAFVFYAPGQTEATFTLEKRGKTTEVTVRGQITANSVSAICELVRHGRGLHLGPVWAFEQDLAEGKVVALLPEYELVAYPVHALYVPGAFVPAKVRAFIDAMHEAVKDSPSLE